MQAMFRTRGRFIGCSMALVLALGALFASSASAAPPVPTHSDLAIGDSLAFGYSLQLKNENEKLGLPPTAFEHGYANYYFNLSKQGGKGLGKLVDTGCPGETTDSMIGNGPLAKAMEENLGAHGEAPCQTYPISQLHRPYTGGKSQLETDLEVLGEQALKGTPVTTLTLNIGANDELHEVAKCEKEAEPSEGAAYVKAYTETLEKGGSKAEAEAAGLAAAQAAGKKYVKTCLEEHAEELFKHILTNVGASLYVIRNASQFGPVPDYTGKIVVQGGYDPYGEVFAGQGEILGGSNLLTSILNFEEKPVVEKFGACYANPQPRFNPGGKREPLRLQAWTNMANTTEFEGKKNGPDIHPTPTGYKELAKVMVTACGLVV